MLATAVFDVQPLALFPYDFVESMNLTIYLPGLAWLDGHTASDACAGLSLPALSQLLRCGTRSTRSGEVSGLVADAFGLKNLAPAGSMAARQGLADGDWLLATPVHIRVERDRVLLMDGVALAQAESGELLAALNAHFVEDGLQFVAGDDWQQWFLRASHPIEAGFAPLMDVIGNDIGDYRPQRDPQLYWSKLLNEVQMLLFTHPVNQRREEQGRPAVNSLWLWGNGQEPIPQAGAQLILSDDALWQRYAQQAGVAFETAPFDLAACFRLADNAQQVAVHLDRLYLPAQHRQPWPWREGMQFLDEYWFAPSLAALRRGQLDSLRLVSHGEYGLDCRIRRSDLWRFWRRGVKLIDLYV